MELPPGAAATVAARVRSRQGNMLKDRGRGRETGKIGQGQVDWTSTGGKGQGNWRGNSGADSLIED